MRSLILSILIFQILSSYSQEEKYRFEFGVGNQSILDWGFRSFEDVSTDLAENKIYSKENYHVDYKNFQFSRGIRIELGLYIVSRASWSIKLSTSCYLERFYDEIFLTLTDIGNGDTIPHSFINYNSTNVNEGYFSKIFYSGLSGGSICSIIISKRIGQLIKSGIGITYSFRSRDAVPDYQR